MSRVQTTAVVDAAATVAESSGASNNTTNVVTTAVTSLSVIWSWIHVARRTLRSTLIHSYLLTVSYGSYCPFENPVCPSDFSEFALHSKLFEELNFWYSGPTIH